MNSKVDLANHGWFHWHCSQVAYRPIPYRIQELNKAIENAPSWVKEATKEQMRNRIVRLQAYERSRA